MNSEAVQSEVSASSSDVRGSDVVPVCAARASWSLAWQLHERGAVEAARDAALDATMAWASDPAELEEEKILEMLVEICGVEARALLGAVQVASALAAWSRQLAPRGEPTRRIGEEPAPAGEVPPPTWLSRRGR